jgi:hypothetical protein
MNYLRQSRIARLMFAAVLCLTLWAAVPAKALPNEEIGADCSGDDCVFYDCWEGPDASYCVYY